MLDTHSHFVHIDSILCADVCHECVPVMTAAQLCEVMGQSTSRWTTVGRIALDFVATSHIFLS